jgi:hypothetical protein
MGRTLNEIIASLPEARRDAIAVRHRALKVEIETRQAKRKAARKGKSASRRSWIPAPRKLR